MKIKEHIMKSSNIEQVNHALIVMRHFIDLSAKLLPFLDEINSKIDPTETDITDRKKIIDVYTTYEFDESTSVLLMNSNILEIIKRTYEKLMCFQSAQSDLKAFQNEINQLRKNWNRIDAN